MIQIIPVNVVLHGDALYVRVDPASILAELAADTGKHYGGLDRFDNVVGNAGVKGAFFVRVGVLCSQKNDRDITACLIAANLLQNFVAGHDRHQYIKQNQ